MNILFLELSNSLTFHQILVYKMNGNGSNLDMLYMAFEKLRAQNTQIIRDAEGMIQEYMHNPECVTSFFTVIMQCEIPVVSSFVIRVIH